jgi:hypothetical protein
MAEELTVDGQLYKKRGPLNVWLLSLITIGIYGLVWYYKVNDEARRYLKDESIRPGLAVLALFPGALIIIPPFISVYRMGERIQRMEERASVHRQVEPVLGLLLLILWSLYPIYYQAHLNSVWDSALSAGARQPSVPAPAASGPAPTPPVPPPPSAIPPTSPHPAPPAAEPLAPGSAPPPEPPATSGT